MSGIAIAPLTRAHWPAVAAIYVEGIATGDATFQTEAPTWERWDADHLPDQRLVAVAGDDVLGWVALGPASNRWVYRGVTEVSVYIAAAARGRGVGRALLTAIIETSEAAGIWTIDAGIFPENASSLALHRSLGFRTMGTRERVGRMADGRWRDVVMLERRSPVI